MRMEVELVDEVRGQYLLGTSPGNRFVRPHRVKAMCADRVAGKFALTPCAIILDTQGRLRNGHHHCHMVVETKLPTALSIVYNCPDEALPHIDRNLPRSIRDALLMGGKGDFGNQIIATVKAYMSLPRAASWRGSDEELLAALYAYAEPLDFSENYLNARDVGITRSVRALAARAYKHHDEHRLAEWCQIICSGMPKSAKTSDDSAAIVYRNFLLRERGNAGNAAEMERYAKGQTAIQAFMDRTPITKVYGTKDDMFPL